MAYKTEIIKLDVYFDLNTPTDKIRADILASLSKYNGVYSYFSNLTLFPRFSKAGKPHFRCGFAFFWKHFL